MQQRSRWERMFQDGLRRLEQGLVEQKAAGVLARLASAEAERIRSALHGSGPSAEAEGYADYFESRAHRYEASDALDRRRIPSAEDLRDALVSFDKAIESATRSSALLVRAGRHDRFFASHATFLACWRNILRYRLAMLNLEFERARSELASVLVVTREHVSRGGKGLPPFFSGLDELEAEEQIVRAGEAFVRRSYREAAKLLYLWLDSAERLQISNWRRNSIRSRAMGLEVVASVGEEEDVSSSLALAEDLNDLVVREALGAASRVWADLVIQLVKGVMSGIGAPGSLAFNSRVDELVGLYPIERWVHRFPTTVGDQDPLKQLPMEFSHLAKQVEAGLARPIQMLEWYLRLSVEFHRRRHADLFLAGSPGITATERSAKLLERTACGELLDELRDISGGLGPTRLSLFERQFGEILGEKEKNLTLDEVLGVMGATFVKFFPLVIRIIGRYGSSVLFEGLSPEAADVRGEITSTASGSIGDTGFYFLTPSYKRQIKAGRLRGDVRGFAAYKSELMDRLQEWVGADVVSGFRQRVDDAASEGPREYELVMERLFGEVFSPPLVFGGRQVVAGDRKRDNIWWLPSGVQRGFWDTARSRFACDGVIVEFKNQERGEKDAIDQVWKYLSLAPVLGRFGLVVARGAASPAAEREQLRLLGDGLLVLCLSEKELLEGLQEKNLGREPSQLLERKWQSLLMRFSK